MTYTGNDGPWRDGLTEAAEGPFITDLRKSIEDHEGRVPHAYQDHKGFWTIGVGHLIDERRGGKLPDHIIDALFAWDVRQVFQELDRAKPWWRDLPDHARAALVEMGFQMGVPSLLNFRMMWAALERRDFEEARDQALDSKWAKTDTPKRAQAVAAKFVEG